MQSDCYSSAMRTCPPVFGNESSVLQIAAQILCHPPTVYPQTIFHWSESQARKFAKMALAIQCIVAVLISNKLQMSSALRKSEKSCSVSMVKQLGRSTQLPSLKAQTQAPNNLL